MTSGGGALEGASGQGARRPSEPHRALSIFIGLRGLSLHYPPCPPSPPPCGSPSGPLPASALKEVTLGNTCPLERLVPAYVLPLPLTCPSISTLLGGGFGGDKDPSG